MEKCSWNERRNGESGGGAPGPTKKGGRWGRGGVDEKKGKRKGERRGEEG